MNRRLTKNEILSRYVKTVQKNTKISLWNYSYTASLSTPHSGNQRTVTQMTMMKGMPSQTMNTVSWFPKFPVDYDYAQGMLVLHKAWSKDNILNSILKDHQETINTFLSMIDKKRSRLWSLFNTTPQ
jgi:hypothetical protein